MELLYNYSRKVLFVFLKSKAVDAKRDEGDKMRTMLTMLKLDFLIVLKLKKTYSADLIWPESGLVVVITQSDFFCMKFS